MTAQAIALSPSDQTLQQLTQRLYDAEDALQTFAAGQLDTVISPTNRAPLLLRQAAEALTASEARYRRLVTRIAAVIFETEPDGTIRFVNAAITKATQYAPEALLGRNWWEVFFPGARSVAARELQAELAAGDISDREMVLTTQNGSLMTLEVNTANRYDTSGQLTHVMGFGVDITDYVRANEASQHLAAIVASSSDAIIAKSLDGTIASWNQGAEGLYGYSAAEAIGQPVSILMPPERRAELTRFLEVVRQGASVQDYETVRVRKDGSRLQVALTISPIRDGVGKIVGASAIMRDITARKVAEAAAQRTQAELRAIIDMIPAKIWFKDTENGILRVNARAAADAGKPVAEVEGKSTVEIYPEQGAWFHELDLEVIHAGVPQLGIIEKHQGEDGTASWIQGDKVPVRDKDGKVVGLVVMTQDITERMRGEETLRASEAEFRTLAEAMPQIVWITRPDGWNMYFNQQWMDYTGLNLEESLGHGWNKPFHPDDQQRAWDAWQHATATIGTYSLECRLRRADGEYRWWLIRGVPLQDSGGNIVKWFGTCTDIHDLKVAEQEITRSNREQRALAQQLKMEKARLVEAQAVAKVGSWELDITTNTLTWSDETYRIFEIGRDEFGASYKAFLELVHPDDRAAVDHSYKESVANHTPYEINHRLLREDGSLKTVYERCQTFYDELGRATHSVGTVQDITESQQATEELRVSEARLQNIMANTPGMVYQYLLNPDGCVAIPFVSGGCRELFEVEPEELQRNPTLPLTLLHPDDRSENQRSLAESARHLLPWSSEWRLQLPSGKTKWVQGVARPQRLPNGGTLWDGLLLDITARKEAEAERDRFFTLSLDMLTIVGDDGYFKRANPAWEATLGFSNAELMAVPFLEFVHPDDIADTLVEMAKLNNGVEVMRFENRYRCRDGSYKWLRWMAVPCEDLWYCVAHDITGIRQAEVALQKANDNLELRVAERTLELHRSREELQSFIDAMSTLAAKVAPDGTFLIFNQIAVDASGLPYEAFRKTNFLTGPWWTFDSQVQTRVGERFREALTGTSINYDESIFAFGQERMINFSLIPIRDAGGQVECLIAEGRDITELKQTEVELQRAKQAADAANLAKSEFLSRMSHELRTPLNAILGFGQMLELDELRPQQLTNVGYILRGGRHLLGLINEVLDLARIEAGAMSLSLEVVAMREVLLECIALVRPVAQPRQIQISILDSAAGGWCDCYVWADQQRLKQVLLNLLGNAIKYNRDGGQVEVRCEDVSPRPNRAASAANGVRGQDGGAVRIGVRDTGPGISPDKMQRLFVPFDRLGAENTTIEGTGIGLVLSRHLIEAMDGTLGMTSTVGEGSTCWLELARAEPPVSALTLSAPVATATATVSSDTRTVLCIEDNLSNFQLIEQLVTFRPSVTLLAAMQGSIGLDLARQHQPDLILLDVHLPDISGYEVLQRLMADASTRAIPVVVISADATAAQIERLRQAGAQDYLTKPIDVPRFL